MQPTSWLTVPRDWLISFLGIFSFNYVFTQTLLATHPEINVIR